MFYHPDLIVYLWLLPVVILIILPASLKTGFALYRHTSWGQAACALEYANKNSAVQSYARRKHPRDDVAGAAAEVAGIGECCTAMVVNISKFGICLINLPQALLNEAEKFKVIVNTQAGNFELLVIPRWKKLLKSGYLVGAKIETAQQA